ncbi:MAG: hypothetical protein MHMPM18_004182 [Marteilia pararefringens]
MSETKVSVGYGEFEKNDEESLQRLLKIIVPIILIITLVVSLLFVIKMDFGCPEGL